MNISNPYATTAGREDFEKYPNSGLTSQITMENPDFWLGMRVAFHINEREEIKGIIVRDNLITARIGLK
jgi:hypothetical protein